MMHFTYPRGERRVHCTYPREERRVHCTYPQGSKKGALYLPQGREKGTLYLSQGREKGALYLSPGEREGCTVLTPGERRVHCTYPRGERRVHCTYPREERRVHCTYPQGREKGALYLLVHYLLHCRYLCVDKRSSTRSLVKTVATSALEEPSDELLDLCSGSFATQDAPRGVVRFPLIHKKPVSGLLSSVAMATSTLEEGTQGTDILALCSGVFPSGSPSQYATQGDGGEEEEGGKGVLERWALRHSQAPQKQDGEEESEDEDMPLLLKRRASLPKPKPTAR